MIPFTQYHLPDGRRTTEYFDADPEIERIAEQFIAAGGRYEAEILSSGVVSFTAVATVDDEPQDVEIVLCPNGPSVINAVTELVNKSSKWTAKLSENIAP